jgi:hypothetical protein
VVIRSFRRCVPANFSTLTSVIRPAVLAAAAVVACSSTAAMAVGPSLWVSDVDGNLGVVDVSTGNVSIIGNTGFLLTDLAFDSNGDLWGMNFTSLYRVNTTTAAATLVGSHGVPTGNALVFGPTGSAFEGMLLAAGRDGNLYSLNTSTGAGTSLGTIGFNSAGDLAFNQGSLYLSSTTGELIRVTTPTVSGTSLGSFGFTNVFGMATAENGILYGTTGTQVISINTASGAGTLVSDFGGRGLGTATGTTFQSEVVPAPSAIALLGLGGLVVGRRRR